MQKIISFNTIPSNLNTNNGYGMAGWNLVRSLQELGYKVPFQDPSAPIEIAFCQPNWSEFSNTNSYNIIYTPWESSILPEGWVERQNEADEVWTTSRMCAKWFRENGVTKPIYVYHHGVDPIWQPRKRVMRGQGIKFYHEGEPAPRKGGQMAFEAFIDAFGKNSKHSLTIKAHRHSRVRNKNPHGVPQDFHSNVKLISADYDKDDMPKLYYDHDVMVYPGLGEGFGLIPLQALATGMPVMCTSIWAPYSKFLHELSLSSKPIDSPWPVMHPGKMHMPDYDQLVEMYRSTAENFEELSAKFYNQAPQVHAEFNWLTLTEKAFKKFDYMFENS